MSEVFIVITPQHGLPAEALRKLILDVEVLDESPKWDVRGEDQIVRVGNVNGGDTVWWDPPTKKYQVEFVVDIEGPDLQFADNVRDELLGELRMYLEPKGPVKLIETSPTVEA